MRVVMLSDLEARGGAAIAANRLARGLAATGQDVRFVTLVPDGNPSRPFVVWSLAEATRQGDRIIRRLPSRTAQHLLRRPLALRALRSALDQLRPDVINVHNLHGGWPLGWSVRHVAECARRAPTVWTLHDMWSFTGRCAYSGDCLRYVGGCDAACPTPSEAPALAPALIGAAWRERRSTFNEAPRLTAVAPSRWLAARAAEGLWRDHTVEVIPYGLPLATFAAHDRAAARQALGLDVAGPVLLAAAAQLDDPRKGVAALVESLRSVERRPLTLLLMGAATPPAVSADVRVVALGLVNSPARQSLVYSAADLYVHSALADNLPNTIMESLACGTPTLAFDVGGVGELVRPGRTGWLVGEVSPAALARGIDAALAALDRDDLRGPCRAVAAAEYGDDLQATRYLGLFERLRAPAS